jgi:hypothetical protein
VGETQRLDGVRNMNGVDVYLSALGLPDGKLLMVAAGNTSDKAIETPLAAGKSRPCLVV